jgi:hypothetical protein
MISSYTHLDISFGSLRLSLFFPHLFSLIISIYKLDKFILKFGILKIKENLERRKIESKFNFLISVGCAKNERSTRSEYTNGKRSQEKRFLIQIQCLFWLRKCYERIV